MNLGQPLTPEQYHVMVKPKRGKSAHPSLRLSERAVTAQVIGTKKAPGFMRVEGWDCIRLQSGTVRGATRGTFMRLGEDGLPDWICIRNQEYVFVETKASDGKLRPAQVAWHEHAARRGYPVMVANGLGSFMVDYRKRWPA